MLTYFPVEVERADTDYRGGLVCWLSWVVNVRDTLVGTELRSTSDGLESHDCGRWNRTAGGLTAYRFRSRNDRGRVCGARPQTRRQILALPPCLCVCICVSDSDGDTRVSERRRPLEVQAGVGVGSRGSQSGV